MIFASALPIRAKEKAREGFEAPARLIDYSISRRKSDQPRWSRLHFR